MRRMRDVQMRSKRRTLKCSTKLVTVDVEKKTTVLWVTCTVGSNCAVSPHMCMLASKVTQV